MIIIIAACFLMAAVAYSNSPEGKAALAESQRKEEERQRNKAQRNYDYAAHTKAACQARGDFRGASYARKDMDKAEKILKNK